MSSATQLLLLPGTRQTHPTTLPSFVKPATDCAEPELQRAIKAVLNAKKVAVVVGAGISTAANIPDFRSSTGLFASLKARFPNAKLTSGRDLFDVNAWKDPDTLSLHFGMLAELHKMCGAAQPTAFHQFLKRLDDDGKLSRVYTQNIDGLEEKAGLSYGIPGSDEIQSLSSSQHRSRQDVPSTPRKRHLKRKRDEPIPTQLPPTPRSTPPPINDSEDQHISVGNDSKIGNSQRAHSESGSTQSELNAQCSSQASVTSTVCPYETNLQSPRKSKLKLECEVVNASLPPRPIKPKPVDPFPRVIPLHGTLKNLSCLTCKHSVLMSDYIVELAEGEPILCPQCQSFEDARALSGFRTRGVGVLKSGVVLYGEEHDAGERVGAVTSRDLMRGRRPDLLIVAGTSLKVPGTKRLVKELSKVIKPTPKVRSDSDEEEDEEETSASSNTKKPRPIHTIFLNNEFPSPCGLWKDTFDVWVKGNVDQFIQLVDEERKIQEEIRTKKAQEKIIRDQKKEEKFRRAISAPQLTFPSAVNNVPESASSSYSSVFLKIPSTPKRNVTTTANKPKKLTIKVSSQPVSSQPTVTHKNSSKPSTTATTKSSTKPSDTTTTTKSSAKPSTTTTSKNSAKSSANKNVTKSSNTKSDSINKAPSSVAGFFKTGKATVACARSVNNGTGNNKKSTATCIKIPSKASTPNNSSSLTVQITPKKKLSSTRYK